MIPTRVARRRSWLAAEEIARVCGGRVLRAGPRALRVVIDSREVRRGDCFVAVRGARFDGHDFVAEALRRGASGVVVASETPAGSVPGAFLVRVADTRKALLAMAAAHRRRHDASVVGITGSCGKTSTKDMLAYVLGRAMPTVASRRSFNNEIGVPLTLFEIRSDTRAVVVEIGSNAPGEVAELAAVAGPDVAVVTCVAEAHLAGLGSVRGVAREKACLPAACRPDGLVVLNGDDVSCRRMAPDAPARSVFVRVDGEADWFATDVRFHGFGTSFRLNGEVPVTLPRIGTHNVYNALFSIAVADRLGVPPTVSLEALSALPATSRRLEVKEVGAITLLDDSYNMNPASARAALLALAGLPCRGRRVAVLGEMAELGPRARELHERLGAEAPACAVDRLVVVGEGARGIADGAVRAGMAAFAVTEVERVTEALDLLLAELGDGDVVLIKASRRAQLDRLADALVDHMGPAPSKGNASAT